MTGANQPSPTTDLLEDTRQPLRQLIGLLIGPLVMLGMAWLMYVLIQIGEQRLDDSGKAQLLDYVRIPREEVSERRERLPERPPASAAPPVPTIAQSQSQSAEGADAALMVMAAPEVSGSVANEAGISLGFSDGEYLPIVKVAPIYPASAARRKLEGECMVEYNVTVNGSVEAVRVVEGHCAHEEFHRPSIEAAARFKYKPRMLNGRPIEVRGVRNVFIYALEQ